MRKKLVRRKIDSFSACLFVFYVHIRWINRSRATFQFHLQKKRKIAFRLYCCYWLKNKHRKIPCKHETFHIKQIQSKSNRIEWMQFLSLLSIFSRYGIRHYRVYVPTQRVFQCSVHVWVCLWNFKERLNFVLPCTLVLWASIECEFSKSIRIQTKRFFLTLECYCCHKSVALGFKRIFF